MYANKGDNWACYMKLSVYLPNRPVIMEKQGESNMEEAGFMEGFRVEGSRFWVEGLGCRP